MGYKALITLILCLLVVSAQAQTHFFNFSPIDKLPAVFARFVPPGYSPLDTAIGDIDMDGRADMILILRRNGEDTISEETARPVLLLTQNKNGTYTLRGRNDNIAYCYTCGGMNSDPLMGITIRNGYFSIENGVMGGQHWQHILTFHYDRKRSDWYLTRDGMESYKSNPDLNDNGEALIMDKQIIRTVKDFGQVRFVDFDVHKDW